MNAPFGHPLDGAEIEPDPIEIDPRPCQLCGCTIDQHERVDTSEGPEFFCDDIERKIVLLADELFQQWKAAEAPPCREPPRRREPYRTPEATVNAFLYVARLDDPDYLARWLDQHPADQPHLFQLWKAKQCTIKT
jgi:hypothetical protein